MVVLVEGCDETGSHSPARSVPEVSEDIEALPTPVIVGSSQRSLIKGGVGKVERAYTAMKPNAPKPGTMEHGVCRKWIEKG